MSCDTLPPHSSTAIEKKHVGMIRIAKHERCMYKVHEQLRDVSEKAYKPVLLAIGPYNDQGKVDGGFMQQHKLRYLEQMLDRTKRSVEIYIKALRDMREIAGKCYVECISRTTDEFLQMMLLDGCFIIELFCKYEIYRKTGVCPDDPIFQMKWVLSRIARDLLLFENQLPFFILAKLLEINEGNGSRNSGEHIVNIEERDEIIVERSSYNSLSTVTRLIGLALDFFSEFLPFKCKFDASSYKPTENIKHLRCRVRVCERVEIWFRLKNAEFEHLLGLVHASISISILDMEIKSAMESQAQRNLREKFEPQHGSESQEEFKQVVNPLLVTMHKKGSERHKQMKLAMATPDGSESQAQRNMLEKMATEFENHLIEIHRWMKIPHAIDLQEAGIEFNKAEKFKDLCDRNKKKDRESICNYLREAKVESNKVKKVRKCLVAPGENKDRNIHSATELQEAGIKFKKAKKHKVVSIKFINGRLWISPLSIHEHTETHLRNLMAYEQYCDRDNNFDYITNYVCFLDDLINSPKDVELLRRSGIIRNYLGDDEATSTMVNKLGQNIVITYRNSIYARTSVDLNTHCSIHCNKWKARLRHDYFNSPWAFVSFMAAVLLLALAIVQTIFSVIP